MTIREEKSFNLIRWFSVLSFLCIALISTVSASLLSRFLKNNILLRDAEVTMSFVQSIARAEKIDKYFEEENIGKTKGAFEEVFHRIAHMPEVVRANVYDAKGDVIWSDDDRLIGHNFMPNPELIEALTGKLVFAAGLSGKPMKGEHVFDVEAPYFAEIYIPIWSETERRVIGVIEIYKVPLLLFTAIKRGNWLVWASAAVGGLFLYASLFWVVRRAASVIRRQQAQLVESERLTVVGEMASAVAHGIRNPLASIRSSAELALEIGSPSIFRQTANDIMLETDRLAGWIKELLVFSGTSAGKFTSILINDLIRLTLESYEQELKQNEIKVNFNLHEPSPKIQGEEIPIRHVFTSLISNALEAMPDRGELAIESRIRDGNEVEIKVKDTGKGIPEEMIRKVFHPFFTTKQNGVGVGLSLAKRIVERHNGAILLTSQEGCGTTVGIRLPLLGSVQK
ncbi:MAG: sensor histidine kinase [Nitrospiria bacterium]